MLCHVSTRRSVCVISSTKNHYCCCYSCCCYLDAARVSCPTLISFNPTLLIREYLSSLVLAHEGLWPLRASCPFLHMALSIEPQASSLLNILVTGSVTQVSLLLPSFPAQSSVSFALAEHSNVTTKASLAAAGLRTFRGRKHIVTATGKHLSSSSSQMGCVSQISGGFNLLPIWILLH